MTQTFIKHHHPAELVKNRALPATIGLNSSSPEWMRECEIRKLAMLDVITFESFLKGATRHRGAEYVNVIEGEVAARRMAMEILRIDHPYINMRLYAQAGLEQSAPSYINNQTAELLAAVNSEHELKNEPATTSPARRGLFQR